MESIGLGMYRRVIEQHVPSGERLVAMTAKQRGNTDLMVCNGKSRGTLTTEVALSAEPGNCECTSLQEAEAGCTGGYNGHTHSTRGPGAQLGIR